MTSTTGPRTPPRRGLGRGLGSLIPSGPLPPQRPEEDDDGSVEYSASPQSTRPAAWGSPDWIGRIPDPPQTAGASDGPEAAPGPASPADPSVAEERSAPEATDGQASPLSVTARAALLHGGTDFRRAETIREPSHTTGTEDGIAPEGSEAATGAPLASVRLVDALIRGETPERWPTDVPVTGTTGGDPEEAQLQPVAGAYFAELPVESVRPNPRQPRQVFDEDSMAELIHSIREVGLLQPVVVRAAGDGYELVMGERRWRATQQAGLATIPAIVRDTGDDDLLRDALLENLHRADLNSLEEAAAYQQLLDDFGCTHEELANRIGRSRPQISNTLRLLKLSPPVQRRVAAGVLSAGHARTLLGVEDAQAQDRLAERVVAEGISVRGLEELVAVGELGGDPKPRSRRPRPTAPAVDDLAERLSDLYETRVKVDLGRTKGRITIEFASVADLERIVSAMDPTYQRRHADE